MALLGHPAIDDQHRAGVPSRAGRARGELGASLTAAFGPQHGMRGDKQYNMDESASYTDSSYGIPVFSLYGEVRRPTAEMLSTFDVLLVDLQDTGWRGYTWVATLLYMLEACAQTGKEVWVLDRPESCRAPDRGQEAHSRSGELRRRRADSPAARA